MLPLTHLTSCIGRLLLRNGSSAHMSQVYLCQTYDETLDIQHPLTDILWCYIHDERTLRSWCVDFSLNMPLAYRVLTYIWKHMGSGSRGFGQNLKGARLKITMLFECHPQKRLVKFTFRSQNCKWIDSGAILWNPAFQGFRKRLKTHGFWRFLEENHEKPM